MTLFRAPAHAAVLANLEQLTDALARGRLCLAEIAHITPTELNALFEMAARRLDAGHIDDAIALFAAAVSLFPYSAKHWRGLAVALQRAGRFEQARAAYEAALLLEPEHGCTACYLGEVFIQLGEHDAALVHLRAARDSLDPAAQRRADLLLRALAMPESAHRQRADMRSDASAPSASTSRFCLTDGRPLPLSDGPFAKADDAYEARTAPEVTNCFFVMNDSTDAMLDTVETAKTHSDPPATQQPAQRPAPPRRATVTITDTAVLPGRGRGRVNAGRRIAEVPDPGTAQRAHDASIHTDITDTAVMSRGRAAQTGGRQADSFVLSTAVRRRRKGDDLTGEITLTGANGRARPKPER